MFVVHLWLSAMTPLAGNRKVMQSFTPFRPWYVACVWVTARLLQPGIKDQVHRSCGQITQNAKTAARFFTAVKTAVVIPKYLLGDPGRTEVTPEGRPVKHRNEYSQSYSIGPAWIWHHGLTHTHTHTHTHPFNSPVSVTTWVCQYQKGKPIWILLKQETVSGSGPCASLHLAPDR